MARRIDPEGKRLPVKIDSTSNGEFAPIPLDRRNREGNHLAHAMASEHARKMRLDRRNFLVSACGTAATFLAVNKVNAMAGKAGGLFDIPDGAAADPELAAASLDGHEFIFDVQGHFVNPTGAWLEKVPEGAKPLSFLPKSQCDTGAWEGDLAYLNCLSGEEFVKDVFLDSDTDMMVLSFVPSARDAEPLTIEEAAAVQNIVASMEGNHRLLLHGRVNPNQPGDLESMDELAEKWKVSAWKTYTQWGPDGTGYFLTDGDTGIPFVEKARKLGVKNICIHKGIPFGQQSYEHSLCTDIGPVARMYPDVNFIIYHSGFVPGQPEGPFAEGAGKDGVDSLIQTLIDNDISPGGNVYAELGSTWRFVMRDPDSAAHTLGKLLRYVGPDNLLWGTDSIWYGSPQDQIQAFRTFQISQEFRERYGYPEITPGIRAKVFGLNATVPYGISADEVKRRARADSLSRRRAAYRENPDPSFQTYGPKTRREFLNLSRWSSGP